MKQNYLKIILGFLSILFIGRIYATGADYVFSASSGTYTAISGGTNLVRSTGSGNIHNDDRYSSATNIGFNFVFDGTTYTQFRASSNGWMSLGSTDPGGALSSNSSSFTDASLNFPMLAPLWDDLSCSGATASYVTTGSAGSRVLTVEWKNAKWDFSNLFANMNFQVKLYEGTNRIDFVYSPLSPIVFNFSGGATIGIRGVTSGTVYFVSLDNSSSSPTASTTTHTSNISSKPAVNQVYTFVPITCFPPTSLTSTTLSTNAEGISWTTPSAGTPTEYIWEVRTSGFPGTGAVGRVLYDSCTSTFDTASVLFSGTLYSLYVRSKCGAGNYSNWAGPYNFGLKPDNDSCLFATELYPNPNMICSNSTPASTLASTSSRSVSSGCGGTPDDDVWFKFTAISTKHFVDINTVSAQTGGSTDMYHEIFSGSCGALTSIKCNDADTSWLTNLVVGNTYYIRVYTVLNTSRAKFNICIKTPESCDDTTQVTKFCITNPMIFPAGVNTGDAMKSNPTNNYGCLGSTPNPAWFYLEVQNSGDLHIKMTNTASIDIDMAIWGPFSSRAAAAAACGSYGTPLDCDYTSSPSAIMDISGATSGQIYVVLVTNYSNAPTNVTLQDDNTTPSTGTTACNNACQIPTNVPTSIGNLCASYECTDANGWTHYINDNGTSSNKSDDILILSLKKGGQNIGTIGSGSFNVCQTVMSGYGSGSGYNLSGAPYVTDPRGWYVMNRWWKVTPTTQPTSPVGVRFYYTGSDLNDVNGSVDRDLNMNEMTFWKVNTPYDANPVNNHVGTTYGSSYLEYIISGTPSTSTWSLGNLGSNFYAEMKVNSFSGGGGGAGGVGGGALPVELLSFKGYAVDGGNVLNWITSSEKNADKFIIESSTDGIDFNSIGTVKASGNSVEEKSYSFIDENPIANRVYYRLKQLDFDGSAHYSNVIVIDRNQKTASDVYLYPNPAKENLFVDIVGVNNFNKVEISDMQGRLIYSTSIIGNGNISKMINTQSLSKGAYVLRLSGDTETMIKRFVVEK